MIQKLKCVIFGDRDVIQDNEHLPEVEKLALLGSWCKM